MIKNLEFILIFFLVCGTIFIFPILGLQSFGIWFFTPFVFMYFLVKERYTIRMNYLLYIFFLFAAYGTIISFLGINIENSLLQQRTIILSIIFAYPIYYYCRLSSKKIYNVFIVFSLLNYLLFYFVLSHDISISVFDADERLLISDSLLLITTNTYGYFLYISTASSMVLFNYFKRSYLSSIHLMLNILISYYLCFLTASRGALFVLSLLCTIFLFYLLIEKLNSFSLSQKISFFLISAILLFNIITFGTSYFQDTLLFNRMGLSFVNDNRIELINEFLSLDYNEYIFGMGSGNSHLISRYGQFSHNGFLETLISYGLIGFVLYLMFCKELISNYNEISDRFSKIIFISIILSYTALHFLYVPYLTHFFLGFILTVYLWKEDLRLA